MVRRHEVGFPSDRKMGSLPNRQKIYTFASPIRASDHYESVAPPPCASVVAGSPRGFDCNSSTWPPHPVASRLLALPCRFSGAHPRLVSYFSGVQFGDYHSWRDWRALAPGSWFLEPGWPSAFRRKDLRVLPGPFSARMLPGGPRASSNYNAEESLGRHRRSQDDRAPNLSHKTSDGVGAFFR